MFSFRENCMKDSAKAFRSLYQRPYFMPQTVEISDTNWIFVSKGSLEHHFDVIEKKGIWFFKEIKIFIWLQVCFCSFLTVKTTVPCTYTIVLLNSSILYVFNVLLDSPLYTLVDADSYEGSVWDCTLSQGPLHQVLCGCSSRVTSGRNQ